MDDIEMFSHVCAKCGLPKNKYDHLSFKGYLYYVFRRFILLLSVFLPVLFVSLQFGLVGVLVFSCYFILRSYLKARCVSCKKMEFVSVDSPVGEKIMSDNGWHVSE